MLTRLSLIVLALAGCGSNNTSHIIDSPSQGGSDSGGDDAGGAAVTLTITTNHVGYPGVTVYFQGADSTLLGTALTDATGTATGSVGTGGFVTAINPVPGSVVSASPDRLVTWNAVLPGDHIEFDNDNNTVMTVTFTVPVPSGVASLVVATTCGKGTIAVPVTSVPPPTLTQAIPLTNCIGTQDVLVVGLDGNAQAVSSFFAPAQTFTDGATISYAAQTYTAAVQRTYTWNNDADNATLEMTDILASSLGTVFSSAQLAAAGIPPTITRRAPAFGTLLDIVEATATVGTTAHGMAEWGQGVTYVGDWGAHRLADFTSAPTYDPTIKMISWSSADGAIQPSAYELEITANRPSDEHAWVWELISATTPVQVPTLPTTIYDWNIAATDTYQVPVGATIAVPGDAQAFRAGFLGIHDFASIVTGASGVISIATYEAVEGFAKARFPVRLR
jgi:hypothetical protein